MSFYSDEKPERMPEGEYRELVKYQFFQLVAFEGRADVANQLAAVVARYADLGERMTDSQREIALNAMLANLWLTGPVAQ